MEVKLNHFQECRFLVLLVIKINMEKTKVSVFKKSKNGSTYKGSFAEGKASGWGIFYHADGDIFKG